MQFSQSEVISVLRSLQDDLPACYDTQRREYPSRKYPTEMLGIHDLGILGMMTAIPN